MHVVPDGPVTASDRSRPQSLRASWWYHIDPHGVAFLRDYRAGNPGVHLSLIESATPNALDLLRSGELDIALVVFSHRLDLTGIEYHVLRTEPCVLVTPLDHPFACRGSVSMDDLAREPLIAPRPGTAARLCLEDSLIGHASPPIVLETNEVAAMLELVSTGVGSAVVTASIATRIGAPVGFVHIIGAPLFVLAVAWAAGPHEPVVQRAIDLLIE